MVTVLYSKLDNQRVFSKGCDGMLVLSGILVMVIGLALRFNTLLVVVAAGFVTGLAGGLSVMDIVGAIGEAFVKNRYMSLFVLILPVIGLMERHGLRERAEILIGKIHAASAGRIFMLYLLIRQVTVALGIGVAGLVAMVRPLISPMSEAAATQGRPVSQRTLDLLRGVAASADNVGNFFGQNLFLAAGGLLLIKGVMEQLGFNVELTDMVIYGVPSALAAYVFSVIRFVIFDKTVQQSIARDQEDYAAGRLVLNDMNILVTPEELGKEG